VSPARDSAHAHQAAPCLDNGFVERLQGTILQEHWRVVFSPSVLHKPPRAPRSLDGFMRYYNEDRPHQGYRVRGRTPATLVWGAVNH